MAELHQVQINEPTKSEQVTLEEQAQLQEEAKSENETTQESPVTEEQQSSDDRPEWLPEKFESPEALADAYENLQKEFHSKKSETDSDKGDEAVAPREGVESAVNEASEQFFKTGELTDENYSSLEAAGIDKELVDMYVRGFQSVQQDESNQIMAEVGGKENYDAMSKWAGEHLTDAELESFNAAVETGDLNTAKLAINGMYARFTRDSGSPVSIQKGQVSGAAVAPFNSMAQVSEAMRDPRYQKDPAYRDQVAKRLSVSKV